MLINRTCEHWIGDERRHCHEHGARPYLIGPRCPEHMPTRIGGVAPTWLGVAVGGART